MDSENGRREPEPTGRKGIRDISAAPDGMQNNFKIISKLFKTKRGNGRKMGREVQHCKQCGREIYFEGICVACRTENERNEILALSQEEMDAAIQKICDEIEESGELDYESELFTKLVNYRDINTEKIAKTAFEKHLFYPAEIYKDAPDDVIRAMLEMLEQDTVDAPLYVSHLLTCLAVHGGEDVFSSFVEFEKHPRKWRKKVHANPSVYATYGGWSFDENGNALKTNFDKCYPMVKGTLDEKKRSPVKIGVRTKEKCPHCGGSLVNLMEIDGRDSRLEFLGIDGVIKAKFCPNHFQYSDDNFCRYTLNGEGEVLLDGESQETEGDIGDAGMEALASNSYVLGNQPVPLRYAADWEGGSAIGGFAFWIQDCVIKSCPDCKKPMKYFAQIQWDTVLDYMEGNAYLEICKDCKVIAILHQQT